MHDAHAQLGEVRYKWGKCACSDTGRCDVSTQCACSERSRGKYKTLEHSNVFYFPTLLFSAKYRTIDRKRSEQIRTDLAVTPTHY